MTLQINGETRTLTACLTVLECLKQLDLPLEVLLVEHNGDALRRDDWATRPIIEGDRLEIIRIVAGG